MSNLVQGVQAVRAELLAGETLADAITFVAEERGLNPALLARKVAESYGPQVAETAQHLRDAEALGEKQATLHRAKVAAENAAFAEMLRDPEFWRLLRGLGHALRR